MKRLVTHLSCSLGTAGQNKVMITLSLKELIHIL